MTLDYLTKWDTFAFSDLKIPLLLFIVGQGLAEGSWALSNWVNLNYIVQIKKKITHQVYSRVLDFEYPFFQESFSGTISAKIENIQKIGSKIFDNIKFNIINRITVLLATAFLFLIVSKTFLVLLLLFYTIFFPTVYYLSKKLHTLSGEYANKQQKTSGLIVDSIGNIFNVFLFSNRSRERKYIHQGLEEVAQSEHKMLRYEFFLQLLIGGIYLSISTGVLLLLIQMRQRGQISIGDFALTLGALFHMLEVSYSLVNNAAQLVKDWGELKESFNLFSKREPISSSQPRVDISKVVKSPSIVFSNVSFGHRGKEPTLSNLSVEIAPGEKVGVVGQSGAGKSTLINLMIRYYTPQNGEILIGGENISNISESSLREQISVVPQETILFHRSIKENIRYSRPSATEEEIIEASIKANIYPFIQSLPQGFETLVGERGVLLSGGQRQRIAIARAFLKGAPILILDEATSHLDSHAEKEIQESLEELMENKTVITVAHRLPTLRKMKRILFLEKGRIIEEGNHTTLLAKANGAYRTLWELQNISAEEFV